MKIIPTFSAVSDDHESLILITRRTREEAVAWLELRQSRISKHGAHDHDDDGQSQEQPGKGCEAEPEERDQGAA